MNVLVLGGSGLLGSAFVRALQERDVNVAFTFFRGEERARTLAAESARGVSRAYALDVEEPGATAAMVDRVAADLNGLDALIHAIGVASIHEPARFDEVTARVASIHEPARFDEVTARVASIHEPARFDEADAARVDDDALEAGWDRLMAINVRSAYVAATRAARHMPRGGNIVLMGSVDGEKCVPSAPPYATSKAAISGMSRALAKAFGPSNIRVNVIAPGILEGGASAVVPASIRGEYLKHTNAKRYGSSSEIAKTAAWFALENTYITGKTFICDGGL